MEQTAREQTSSGTASRQRFLQQAGAVTAGAFLAVAATTVNPIRDGVAFARTQAAGLTDLDILNFALTLEHLEATFYQQVVRSGHFDSPALGILAAIRNHEQQHVAALTAAINQLGGKPVAAMMRYNFGDMSSAAAILATAEKLEGTGVGAYTGAAGLITNRAALVPVAGSIEQVEARHYASIRILLNENPAPAALGPILTVAEVQMAVKPILGM